MSASGEIAKVRLSYGAVDRQISKAGRINATFHKGVSPETLEVRITNVNAI